MRKSAVTLGIMALVAFAAFLATPRYASAAFGISPPFINADHMVKGASFNQTVYLVQDQPDQDLPISVTMQIPESIKDWVSFDSGKDFVIPKGMRQFPVVVTIKVPFDASLGDYTGSINFSGKPAKAGQVTIALGVQSNLHISVGNDIYHKFSVPIVKLMDIEEGGNPTVLVRVDNEGNVPESFTGASYELIDQYGDKTIAFIQKRDGFPEIPAFTKKEFTVEFPTSFHLDIGQYWGSVNFYQNDKVIASQKTVFNVVKVGTLSGRLGIFINNLKVNWPYYSGGIIILIGTIVIVSRRRYATA